MSRLIDVIAGRCSRCGYKKPKHGPYCEHATIEDVKHGLHASDAKASHYRGKLEVRTSQVELWQAKFHTVKHENNKLRAKYHRLVEQQPTVVLVFDLLDAADAVVAGGDLDVLRKALSAIYGGGYISEQMEVKNVPAIPDSDTSAALTDE